MGGGGCHRCPNARSSADGWLNPELNNKYDKDRLLFLGRYQQGSCKIFERERERERERGRGREREWYLQAVANTNVPYICGATAAEATQSCKTSADCDQISINASPCVQQFRRDVNKTH